MLPGISILTKIKIARYWLRYYQSLGLPASQSEPLVLAHLNPEHEARRVRHLESLLGHSITGLSVLDVGCGTGGFLRAAQAAGARECYGLDPDPEACAIAGGVCGRAESMDFDRRFDLVYSYSVLEHCQQPDQALLQMIRATRRYLYLHVPNRRAWWEGHYKIWWCPLFWRWRWMGRAYLWLRRRPRSSLTSIHPPGDLVTLTAWIRNHGYRILHQGRPRHSLEILAVRQDD